jgi:hypothetical protein
MKSITESVSKFGEAMVDRLTANARKGHWANCHNGYLRRRLRTETRELFALLDKANRTGLTPELRKAIVHEAADVANFAMMIAENNGS